MVRRRKAVTVNDLQASSRELRSAHVNIGQGMVPLSLDEAVNEQNNCCLAMTKGQISANHFRRNGQVSLCTDQHKGQNTDEKVLEQHVDPQENLVAITRGKRSKRIANNNQRREESTFDADQRVGGNTNESATEQHDDPKDEVFKQPKARGYTYMPRLWAIGSEHSNIQPLKIEFNKYGKPIGPNKSNYVEFLGCIVRNGNLAPLNFKDWHKVPANFKKDMLDKVKGSFAVPIGYDKFILQALSKSWRAFKCRIKAKYFNPKSTMEQNSRRRPDTHDERVKEDQWKSLVEYWCSEESKKISNKNKETRAMKKMHHATGKRSFAQVHEMAKEEALHNVGTGENDVDEEESGISDLARAEICSRDGNTFTPEVANALETVQQLKSQLPPGARDERPNDIYSQVLGEDVGGRAHMYGYRRTADEETMQQLKSQLLPGARDERPNDIYSQVLGEDVGGRAHMYGYRKTADEVYGSNSLGRDDIHRIAMEKERLEKELEEKNKLIEMLLRNEDLRGQLEEKNKLIETLLRKQNLRGHSNITNTPSTSPNSALAQASGPSSSNSRPLQVQITL